MRQLTQKQVEQIKFWHSKGLSVRKIKEKLNVSLGVICKHIKTNKIEKQEKSNGRPSKVPIKIHKHLVRLFLSGFLRNSTDAVFYLKNSHNLTVSNQTVRNILRKNKLVNRVKPLKPRLMNRHKEARHEYAKLMDKKPEGFWKQVIFTDESKYNLYGPDGYKRVWLLPGAPLQDHQVRQVVKFGGGKVMVWGAITYKGVGKLVFIDGTMDTDKYIHILSTGYLSTLKMHKYKVKETYLLQDNDPKHKAVDTIDYLKSKKIKLIPHPACSPDMNPIEHVWNDVNTRLRARPVQLKDLVELQAAVEEEWYKTPLEYIQCLIDSMVTRIKVLKKAKGGFTKY